MVLFVKRRNLCACVIGFLVIVGFLASPILVPAQPVQRTAVRAAYIPATSWLPAWVAKDKGFFTEHGLDVTLTPTQNVSVLPATLGKQLDIAPSTPTDLIKSAASGLDVVTIAGMTIESSANRYVDLIVRKDSGITSVKDLKGKIVASPAMGAITHVAVLSWVKHNGIDPDSVRGVEVPYPNMGDQLKAKSVDAIESIQPFAGALLANPDNMSLSDPILTVADPSLFTMWIAQGAWARVNKPVIAAWTASLQEAIDFIAKNPAEARAVMAKYTNLPEAVVQRISFPQYSLSVAPAQVAVWAKALADLDQIASGVDVSKMIVTAQ
jgi:ABC-type nitrate/sulfonate/bicarbonate transport system substrate-binding protein